MDTREFLGMGALDDDRLHWELDVEPGLSTPGEFMYGGCGLAAGIVSMEIASGRPTVWATAQYLSFAATGSHLELDVVLAAVGRKTTQARSIARVGDKEILTVNSALGQPTGEFLGIYVEPPLVERPENCAPRGSFSGPLAESVFDKIETRQALGRSWGEMSESRPREEPARSAIWARMPGHLGMEAAALAVFGDLVSGGVSQVVGRPSHGSSLDNTIRIAELSPTEWVLCDITIQAIAGGYAQGHANLWSEEGRLLATASQSMSARTFAG
ncbi:MAG: acyl-CoA thioesterase [Acidimicrobiales bacterium]